MKPTGIDRRSFMGQGAAAGAALALAPWSPSAQAAGPGKDKPRPVRVGVIGCGSVSHVYLPHLASCPHVELVSACDIIPQRAKARAERYSIPNQYPHIDKLLAGAPFDLRDFTPSPRG